MRGPLNVKFLKRSASKDLMDLDKDTQTKGSEGRGGGGGGGGVSVYGCQPYYLHVPTVLKSGSLSLLEPSGPE